MTTLAQGMTAIDFDLPAVDGNHYNLNSFAHPLLAIIFSCNHCPYVRAWEGRMIAIQRDYAARGLQLVVINANDATKKPGDDFPGMVARATEKQFNFPYLHDESQQVARAYGAQRTPEVFLFDAERSLRYHGAIDDNYEDPSAVQSHYLRTAIDSLLEGHTPPVTETPPVGCTIKWKDN